jgi:recombination protein RecT
MANDLAIIERQFEPLLPRLADALGAMRDQLPVGRLMQTIMVSLEANHDLVTANRQTLFNAALTFAFLGLEVDGVTGQGYLIPFKGRVQAVIGYKGYNTLAARSGLTINGACVREGDTFDFELGSSPYIRHRPALGGTDRKVIGAWASAAAVSRPAIVAVLGLDELLAVKAASPRGKSPPWSDNKIGFPAMCEKTAKRRLARGMPLNVMQYAARMEEAHEEQGAIAYIDPTRGVVADRELTEPPTAGELTRTTDRSSWTSGSVQDAEEPPPGHNTQAAPGASASALSEDLKRFRDQLDRASNIGTIELQATWNGIKFAFRANLQKDFDKLWWPRALAADRDQSEREERLI